MSVDLAPPRLSLRLVQVWRRNLLVWRKLLVPSLLGNLADPALSLLGLGYGLGSMLPAVDGVAYITFLAAGIVCYSTMNSASFEGLYSAFSRMHVQRTWEAIMNAPVGLDDIVCAEIAWAATKSTFSGLAILLLIWVLGLSHSPLTLWLVPLTLLIGIVFGAFAVTMTTLAPSYDFFMYYFTLFITPMVLLSGVFYPVSALPALLQQIAVALPLLHAIELARPLVYGRVPEAVLTHLLVLVCYALVGSYLAVVLARRRLLK